MNELDPLEKQLQSWTPRRPSADISEKLFGESEAPRAPRGNVFAWNWLTPVAACFLAMIMVVRSNHRLTEMNEKDHATFFATVMMNAASNSQQTFALNKFDVNLEWNVWPHVDGRTTNRNPVSFASADFLTAKTNR